MRGGPRGLPRPALTRLLASRPAQTAVAFEWALKSDDEKAMDDPIARKVSHVGWEGDTDVIDDVLMPSPLALLERMKSSGKVVDSTKFQVSPDRARARAPGAAARSRPPTQEMMFKHRDTQLGQLFKDLIEGVQQAAATPPPAS